MIRRGMVIVGSLLIAAIPIRAQRDSLDELEQELKEAKQQHQDMTAQALSNFFTQIDTAMGNPDAAIALYQQAGGILPDRTPVVTEHQDESATEKDARLAQDQANLAALGTLLQLHCGIMHFAASFVVRPNQKGLQDDWASWLQKAAQVYPQLDLPPPGIGQPSPDAHKRRRDAGASPHGFNPSELMGKSMKDSVIGKYLAFQQWGDKEQGNWSVRALPGLYKSTILDPLRAKPTETTLAAWDVYIAMQDADEKDPDRWQQVVYPPLLFDRSCDDYAVTPSTEKLEALVNMIKANPTFPQVDDWISRTKQLMDDYRSPHGGKSIIAQNPAPPANLTPPANPNVTVTTQQQGDQTVITTHTNSPPANPAPPQ